MRPSIQKITCFLSSNPHLFVGDPAYQLGTLRYAPEMSEVIWEAKRALEKGIAPVRCDQGTCETYFLYGEEGQPLAVFKLGHYLREYAAYRLDHKGFAAVPPTVISTLSHPLFGGEVTGSCQLFVEDSVAAVNLPRKAFAAFSSPSIRRMAQLDIRLINEDRHTSNILIRNKSEAIPIDHGFVMPSDLGAVNYVWVYWDQAATPFSEEESGYISYLDPEQDRAFLIEEMRLSEKIANRFYVSTMLLKLGVIYGFSPSQIGDILSKSLNGEASDSKFETLVKRLKRRKAPNWIIFTKYVNEEIGVILEEYEADQYTHFQIPG